MQLNLLSFFWGGGFHSPSGVSDEELLDVRVKNKPSSSAPGIQAADLTAQSQSTVHIVDSRTTVLSQQRRRQRLPSHDYDVDKERKRSKR